jgi:hypothetical protein
MQIDIDTSCLDAGVTVYLESAMYDFEGELLHGETPEDIEDIDTTGIFFILCSDTNEKIRINGWLFSCEVLN